MHIYWSVLSTFLIDFLVSVYWSIARECFTIYNKKCFIIIIGTGVRRMVFWFRLCDTKFYQYMAVDYRSSPRVPDDASPNSQVFILKSFLLLFHLCKRKTLVAFSGNVTIETKFFDDTLLVSTSKVRLFYVWEPNWIFLGHMKWKHIFYELNKEFTNECFTSHTIDDAILSHSSHIFSGQFFFLSFSLYPLKQHSSCSQLFIITTIILYAWVYHHFCHVWLWFGRTHAPRSLYALFRLLTAPLLTAAVRIGMMIVIQLQSANTVSTLILWGKKPNPFFSIIFLPLLRSHSLLTTHDMRRFPLRRYTNFASCCSCALELNYVIL